jgi:protein-tyrosine phosphatase
MRVDIHNHILWGLDDGARTKEDTLSMARMAIDNGITHVIATPHHQNGIYNNPYEIVMERVEEANELLKEHSLPLTILPGMEIRLYGDIIHDFQRVERTLLALNDGNRYILIELPDDHVPRYTSKLLFDLQVEGFVPIIAHPERNREIREQPNMLHKIVEKGALTQLTAGSVLGLFETELQKFSRSLIEHDLVHLIASDAHNTAHRGFALKQAYKWINENIGREYTKTFEINAENILYGEDIYVAEPRRFEKKRFLGLF